MPEKYSPIDSRSKRDRYMALKGKMWSDRSTYETHWRELSEFLLPRRTRWMMQDRNRGDKRNAKIIDSTARFAVRTLASGLHAGLTSPARPWFKLTTPDPNLRKLPAVKAWLHQVTQRISSAFLQSNIYNSLPIVYGDMGTFGTAAMAVMEDRQETLRTYTFPIGSYAISSDERGIVTTFVRELEMTVRQLVGRYAVKDNGDIDWTNVSRTVKGAWDRGDYEQAVQVCWIVQPNSDANPDKLGAKYYPFSSCHFELTTDEGKLLRESGFKQFPILAPRWARASSEDSYGDDCPGMTALGDVKQLQSMQKKKGQAISKLVDPPLVGPTMLRTQTTSLLAGAITYQDVRDGERGLRPIHEIGMNLQHLTMDIQDVRYLIRRAFHEDLFLMLASSDPSRGAADITAREIEERHEEKLLALGPVLESTNDELLDPLIDRSYQMLFDAGLLPEVPEELDNVELKIEYLSIMASAQKLVGVVGQDRLLQTVVPLAEVFPEITDKIDVNRIVDNYVDMLGVDPEVVRTTEQANARSEGRQKQAAAMQQAEQAKLMAGAAKDAAAAPVGGEETVLTRLVQGVSAQGLQDAVP